MPTATASQTSGSTPTAPSTPVKVPSAAASYTPATLDPDLRSQINMVLIRDGHVTKIQDQLLHLLQADATNWPALIQAHALQLLRSGDCSNFPALMCRVMDDIRRDTVLARSTANGKGTTNGNGTSSSTSSSTANGDAKKNGTASSDEESSPTPSLALPKSVVEEALRVTRESLEAVCEIEE